MAIISPIRAISVRAASLHDFHSVTWPTVARHVLILTLAAVNPDRINRRSPTAWRHDIGRGSYGNRCMVEYLPV